MLNAAKGELIMETKVNYEEEKGLHIIHKERRGCRPLKLRAIPHVGILPDNIAPAVTIMKPVTKVDLNSIPAKAKVGVREFISKYPQGQLDFFVINVNAERLKGKLSAQNLNLHYILHPYSMNKYKADQDKSVKVYMSLYRLNELDPIYSVKEGIEIDSEKILDKTCLRTISIKNNKGELEMSKEGVEFVINSYYPVVAFFGLSVHILKEKPTLLISL